MSSPEMKAYCQRQRRAQELIEELQAALLKHGDRVQADGGPGWADVGDLGPVIERLEQAACFAKGETA